MRNKIMHPNFGEDEEISTIIKENSNNVRYNIKNGIVTKLSLDRQSKALIMSITPSEDGELTIELPRKLIDSKNDEGDDDMFLILIDGAERDFTEIKVGTDRILTIKFLKDEQYVEVIGTEITTVDYF